MSETPPVPGPLQSTISSHADTEVGGPTTVPETRNPSELVPGTMVGDYRIEGMLGSGGMGEVYAAIHPVIGKRAAIKVLRAELSVNRESVERFVQEARAVNQIGHPNIVDVFAFAALPDGRSYFVMEWLKGESLRARIQRERMTLAEVVHVVDKICVALDAAHEKGIVHRDLKPDNVFLTAVRGAEPMVKLLDFGIAKLLGSEDTRLERTRTGNLLGTPAYIAPEQARGETIDQRVDVYSLGAMAYEMLTRSLPFPARSAMDMVAQHLYTEPPSIRAKDPSFPEELDALVRRMMAKAPDERPTLAEVRRGFAESRDARRVVGAEAAPPLATAETVISVSGAVSAAEPPRARRPARWIAPALIVIGAGGVGAGYLLTRDGGGPSAAPAVTTPAVTVDAAVAAPVVEPIVDAGAAAVAPVEVEVDAAAPETKKTRSRSERKRRRDASRNTEKTTEPTKPPPPDDDDALMEPK